MDNGQNARVMEAIRDFKAKVSEKYRLEKAILFGSRARGDWLTDSDVDLLLVSDDFGALNFRKRMSALLEFWDYPLDLEVLAYTPQEYERMRKRMGIVKAASEEGIAV